MLYTPTHNNFIHLPFLTLVTENNLDEIDIENDLDIIVREMDYEKNSQIEIKSMFINLYKIQKIKLDLPTFENITTERTKMVI